MSKKLAVVLIMTFCLLLVSSQVTLSAQDILVPEGFIVEVYVENIPMPKGLSFDSQSNLYVGHDEVNNGRIYRIDREGSVVLWGPELDDPDCVAVDSEDHVFVGSENGLYRVAPDGTSMLFTSDYMGNNSCLTIDHGGIFGREGTIFVGNARSENDIVRVESDGVASVFVPNSELYTPHGLAFDHEEYLYAAEFSNGYVYRITADGETSRFVKFAAPRCISFDQTYRELYVGDIDEDRIYRVSLSGEVNIFAEGIVPHGLTFGLDGSLYVSDRSITPHRILRISRICPRITTCDVNGDGRVDILDLVLIAQHFGEHITEPIDPNPDVNCDGKIDILDIILVVEHFGEVHS